MQTPPNVPKPLIIPVFIPNAGCPHRCAFCNQSATTGQCEPFPGAKQIHESIERFLDYAGPKRGFREIAFFGGNFLGLPVQQIEQLLDLARQYILRGRVQGIRFSTRPDTIDAARLDLIAPYGVSTVEIGVQSLNDEVLRQSRRGHDAQTTEAAVNLIRRQTGYRLGLQMMIGLPGDSAGSALETARRIIGWHPDFVRIYPTLVLKHSLLEKWQTRGGYTPLSLDEAVDQAKALYALFVGKGIQVIRMGLQPTGELSPNAAVVDGPFHPAFGELVISALWLDVLTAHFKRRGIRQQAVTLTLNPRKVSQVKGLKNLNMEKLTSVFNLSALDIQQDASLPADTVLVNGEACRFPGDASEAAPEADING
ncbi:MAG: radical SAM protein [Desulfosarcinaceae bacterium]